MSIEKIKAFPEVTTVILNDDNTVESVTQEYYDIDKVKAHIQGCIKTVRKYEKMGYYNLAKPEFVNEVITTFTNLELSKKDVIRVNNFMDIQGTTECNRVWQLPDETKVQVSQRLHGFQITYDTENWEDFSIQELKDNPTN
ncbi:hypothetical protein [uncultured Gammaproteobacteria bacterium]|jgi:uncharacterized protein YlzI (FlbEa/FlbD family)|nr:hypothetical protein BROOK1789C_1393 [Bathymodiolus brooksi thiotrophic gill symbiont]CAC9552430.1 hypothetical protein [uncultured Gammaproteobacteria bacterium]CAC9558655.1 hypothetical protein [uncultured Gammaproteobacteria bacterium]CAC9589469.1 hypothetical protein [uncultured Gammaproteobacteria bacterium]CAC9626555.1 hypothetical protein [uncultured Gammaproteobacteria bacterium]